MKTFNIFLIIITCFILLTLLCSCNLDLNSIYWNGDHPEIIYINDNYNLATSPNGVLLYWHSDDSHELEDDRFIIDKNFIAYTVKDNIVFLCEELKDDTQDFWTFDLETEELKTYDKYSELTKDYGYSIEDKDWEELWSEDFKLKKD